ncbi:mucin TcMUCII [Trypanosoma cruzi cruzi]|nr:mucin TcMUCII [Trypanosoma cruzi cruzi]
MMMTCRLLCALLVLALCCCPSVCVADTELKDNENGVQEQGGGMPPPPPQPKVNNDKVNIQAVGKDVGESSLLLEGDQGKGHSDLPTTGSVAKLGNGGGGGPVSTSTEGLGPNKVPNTLKADGNKVRQGHPVTRDYPRNRQIVSLKILPRRPRRPQQRHQPRPLPLQRRHQALRLQRR